MSGLQSVKLLIDVCSLGGNVLLNVGPDEHGNIPDLQLKCLEYMGDYMEVNEAAIDGTEEVDEKIAQAVGDDQSTDGWVRWLRKGDRIFVFVDGEGAVKLPIDAKRVDLRSAKLLSGEKVELKNATVDLSATKALRPVCIELKAL